MLIIGLATFLAMTVALVVDATAAYLQRQGLDTLADGAALRGADLGATGRDVYEGGVPQDRLELTAAQVRQAVDAYLRGDGRVRPLTRACPTGSGSTPRRRASRSRSARRWTCR